MADPPGVSVAFADVWNEPAPTWTRIDTLAGCRVRGWTVDRGRPDEFSKTDVGTATVRIADLDGIFDPTNATSPYNGQIQPGRQAAISLWNPVSETWHIRFRGDVEAWRYVLEQTRQMMELELQLVDGFAVLARRELRVGVDGALPPFTGFPTAQQTALAALAKGNILYGETVGTVGDRVRSILADAEWPDDLAVPWDDALVPPLIPDIFSGNVRVGPKAYAPGTSALDALWDAADAEFPGVGQCYMSAAGHFRYRGRQARFRPDVAEYGIERRTVGDPSATAGDTTVVPVAELEWTTSNDNLFNAATATPQGIGSGDLWRTLNPDPPDNDDVEGQLVQDISVGGSIATHGLRSLTFDNLQTIEGKATGNDAMIETRLFATYYVENYKNPQPRISRLVFKTRRPGSPNSGALWEHLSNCEIGDLLTLETAHPGGGGFFHEFYVEGLHYNCTPGPPTHAVVELSLDVSPRAHYTTNPFDLDPDPGD